MKFLMADILSGILHVCGGDPVSLAGGTNGTKYSPRMWR